MSAYNVHLLPEVKKEDTVVFIIFFFTYILTYEVELLVHMYLLSLLNTLGADIGGPL